jgi:hypothetical protein
MCPDGLDFPHSMSGVYDFLTDLKHSDLLVNDRFEAGIRNLARDEGLNVLRCWLRREENGI